VIQAVSIAGASTRLKCIAFGAVDYTLDIGTKLSREGYELFHARAHIVVASRAGFCDHQSHIYHFRGQTLVIIHVENYS
jgi:citrate lyase beta subunit